MKIYLFYHSVISDWNHGNAHFLRGIISSLYCLGHQVTVLEPKEGWSIRNLLAEKGDDVFRDFRRFFPNHTPVIFTEDTFRASDYLSDADLVIVHEWNSPELIREIGAFRKKNDRMILLFHDTHHRSVTKPEEMARYDLRYYDGVLAFGEVIRNIYLKNNWTENSWTWHEAADDRIFHPVLSKEKDGDLVWIGNWGDDERTEELEEYIIDPVVSLKLKAAFYGVRYPLKALKMLKKAKIKYKGWIPNYQVPEIFSRYRVTVHVPRKPYVENLPGIPTIRPFEALSCAIPLVCSPWKDTENLFTPGKDFLVARNGDEMKSHIASILANERLASALTSHGLETIRNRHTCDHRAGQLLEIVNEIRAKRTIKAVEPVEAVI